jgi:hypothetical protein
MDRIHSDAIVRNIAERRTEDLLHFVRRVRERMRELDPE